MPEKPEQPDLFEWKPKKKIFSRLFYFLKSAKFLWVVYWTLFIPVIIADNIFILKFIEIGESFHFDGFFFLFFLTLFFLIIYTVKRPQNVIPKLKSGYFWLLLFSVLFVAYLHSQGAAERFLKGFIRNWLFTIGLLTAIAVFLFIKRPPFFLDLLKSKVVWFFFTVNSLLFLLRFQQTIAGLTTKFWIFPLGIGLVAASLLAIWKIPLWLTQSLLTKKGNETQSEFEREEKRLKMVDDTRKTIATIIGGLFVVVGAVFTYSNYELSAEGQVTNRFSTAVVLLKDDDSSVRLGGLYALERIAKDSPKDHSTIMEILAVYIRERSRLQKEKNVKNKSTDGNQNLTANIAAENEFNGNINTANNNTANSNQPAKKIDELPAPVDILAAAEIIRRRKVKNDKPDSFFDLSNANLNGATLYSTDLRQVKLNNAGLRKANLQESELFDAQFNNADLSYADLGSAKLLSANFSGANLSDASLSGTELRNANFTDSILTNAFLFGAKLDSANFNNANLNKAVLSSAELYNASLKNADLSEAELHYAELEETDFRFANLWEADFTGAKFNDTNLSGADLRFCKNLEFEQISLAIIDSETKLPDYLEPRRAELLKLSKERLLEKTDNSKK